MNFVSLDSRRPKIFRSCLSGALLLAVAIVAKPADAADALRGKSLYASTPGGTSCANSSCHGTNPSSNKNKILRGANSPSTIQNAINNDTGGMGIYRNNVLTPTDVADIAAYIANPNIASGPIATVSPTSLAFTSTPVGNTSASQTVTLKNTGGSALSLTAISVTGTHFAVTGGTCAAGGSVAAAGSCTILVVFRPQAVGALSSSLSVTHNATGGPSAISLSGTGAAVVPTVTVTPASLSFAAQNVGTGSAAQTATVSNTGNASLSFTALTITGINAADFARSGTCAVGTAVPAGSSCTASIVFTPQAPGTRSAVLSLASNASNGSVNVTLSGIATAAAQPAVNPPSLNFGSVTVGTQGAAQNVSVNNSGTVPLILGAITVSGTQFSVNGGTCASGSTVAAGGGSCTVQIVFAPTAAGASSATLSIAHNASGGPLMVAISGNGTAPATPVAQLSPTALSFSQVVGSPSAAQLVTLTNAGTTTLSIASVGLNGAASGDYTIGSGSTCTAGGNVSPGASCNVSLVFTPTATGSRAASLSIVHGDAARSPSTASLNGTGTASPSGLLSANQIALNFQAQSIGTSSSAQSVTLSNSGSAPLTLSSVSIGGSNAGDFALQSGANSCTSTTTLSAGASCIANIVFTPAVASGTRSAGLVVSAGSAGSVSVSLAGTAAAAAAPIVSLNPGNLDFGSIAVSQTSTLRTMTLTNSGSAALLVNSLVASPSAFLLSHDCPASILVSASCTLTVSFTPNAEGLASGTITLASNAPNSPNIFALSGAGIAPAPATLSWLSSATLTFADTAAGAQSAPQSVVMLNSGASPALLQTFQFAGAASTEFAIDPSSTCVVGGSLAAGSNCTMSIVFAPISAGPRSANMNVGSNATPPQALNLSGNGVAGGAPMLSLSPISMTLTGAAGQPLQPQVLVISSDGAAALQVTAVQAGADLAILDSSSTGGGNCRPVPFTLAPGASCTLMVNPLANQINSTIQISSNASTQPAQVSVTGSALSNVGAGGSAASLLLLAAAALRRRRLGLA